MKVRYLFRCWLALAMFPYISARKLFVSSSQFLKWVRRTNALYFLYLPFVLRLGDCQNEYKKVLQFVYKLVPKSGTEKPQGRKAIRLSLPEAFRIFSHGSNNT